MKLKESEYNFIYEGLDKNQVVFYNSFTGALAIVKETQYEQFQDFQKTGKEIEDKEFLENLLRCGFVLSEGIDERFLIKTRMLAGRFNKNTLALTIAPTMACNFRCVYCFEQGHYGNRLMDETTQKNLMAFIKKHLNGVKILNVTWFGGEPLMGMSVIESLSQQIIELCEEKEIKYSAGIITNGYLLTKETAEKLKEYKVQYAQVTVDGPKEIHDTRRPMLNGQGTYDVIMENLMEIKGILPIMLRINVDYENAEAADRVMDYLKERELLSSVYPTLGLVEPENEKYQKEKCLTDELYSRINLKFLLENHIPLQNTYPRPHSNYCGADFCNNWVIDDAGYLYKCWSDIGILERAIGNINKKESYIQQTKMLAEYTAFDPLLCAECKDCKILPVCMGGCPHNRIEGRMVCEQRRFHMEEYMMECAKSLLNNKKKS